MDETEIRPNMKKALEKGLDKTGWSKNELCRQAGVGLSSVKNFLSGKAKYPQIDTVFKIAAALEKTVSEFIGEPDARISPDDELVLQTSRKLTVETRQVWIAQAAAFTTLPESDDTPSIVLAPETETIDYSDPKRRPDRTRRP